VRQQAQSFEYMMYEILCFSALSEKLLGLPTRLKDGLVRLEIRHFERRVRNFVSKLGGRARIATLLGDTAFSEL